MELFKVMSLSVVVETPEGLVVAPENQKLRFSPAPFLVECAE